MSHDDILDNMSLSDDDMLNDLADDMLEEIEMERSISSVPTIQSTSSTINTRPQNAMPDLGQMMSQMMPMLSQVLAGNPNAQQQYSLQQSRESWQDTIKRYIPNEEQQEWINTITTDLDIQKEQTNGLKYPPSRSYAPPSKALPNAYFQSNTLLQHLLIEAIRSAKCDVNTLSIMEDEKNESLAELITNSGLIKVFQKEFIQKLKYRVTTDKDYDEEIQTNITKALSTIVS